MENRIAGLDETDLRTLDWLIFYFDQAASHTIKRLRINAAGETLQKIVGSLG